MNDQVQNPYNFRHFGLIHFVMHVDGKHPIRGSDDGYRAREDEGLGLQSWVTERSSKARTFIIRTRVSRSHATCS